MSKMEFFYIIWGYLSGSILFARVFGWVFKKGDVTAESRDGNPGAANAFKYGGFWCGIFTLLGDLMKGFLPVYCYMQYLESQPSGLKWWLALVLVTPVLGHAFPLYYHFKGGKGIAVTFGCLLGLLPEIEPVAILVIMFLFFTLVLRVSPHFQRTILTYLCATVLMFVFPVRAEVRLGFLLIMGTVLLRMHLSEEEREKIKVKLLWRR